MIDLYAFRQDDTFMVVDTDNLTITRADITVAIPLDTWDKLLDQIRLAAAQPEPSAIEAEAAE